MNHLRRIIPQLYNYFILAIFLLIGFVIYNDYGVSLDEDAYINNARIEYNFLKSFLLGNDFYQNYDIYFNKVGKFSNIFYLIVFLINDLFSFNIYSILHLLLFFIFLISCFFFSKTIFERFNNNIFSYISFFLLLSTPRFFAESFYNARDLFFLEITIFFLYFFFKIIKNFNFTNILFLSSFSAISISIRFFGLIIFIISIFLLVLEFEDKIKFKKLLYKILQLVFFTFLFFYIITPYLWLNPITNFIKFYFLDLQNTSGTRITNIFLGNLYSSQNSPWYYYTIWILFTVPFTFIFLSFLGFIKEFFLYLKRLINLDKNKNIWESKNEMLDFFIILILSIFIYFISRFSSVSMDGWRHLYFLYPLIVYCVFMFLNSIKKFKNIFLIIFTILIIQVIINFIWIYKNHPHQYVYFNFLDRFNKKTNFDLDYWGLSNYSIYKYILSDKKVGQITIGTVSYNDLYDNYNLLEKKSRDRIKIISAKQLPTYLIDNYRIPYKIDKINLERKHLLNYDKVYEIIVDKNIISTLYKIR